MNVLTVKEMRDFDAYTLEKLDISEFELMHRAGVALVDDFIERVKPKSTDVISIFAGVGNNGGDALVMAVELQNQAYYTDVYILGDILRCSGSFKFYYDKISQSYNLQSVADMDSYSEIFSKSDIIIDGIFGVGLSKPITGFRAQLIKNLNQLNSVKYSIDIPSGINPNNGLLFNEAIRADYTGIIAYHKLGNLLNDALDYHGDSKVLDIGIQAKYEVKREYIDFQEIGLNLPRLKHNSNKYSAGSGLFIGGRKSMMGSIQMSAMAGMKSGLGIVFVYADLESEFTQFYPELIIQDFKDPSLNQKIVKAKASVFGPGLPECNDYCRDLLEMLLNTETSVVIDASGLQYLNLERDYHNSQIVITPHSGEMARILGISTKDILNNPLENIKKLTAKGLNVILKGACTIISDDEKQVFIQAKNPGLATAGSGDVLSGILAGMLARCETYESMVNAVLLHTKAADYARRRFGEISLVASDIINAIPEVLVKEESDV